MKSIPIAVITAVLVASVSGCVSHGRDFDTTKVSQIQKGVTTEADLVQWFGQPFQRGQNENGEMTLTWAYVTSEGLFETKERGLLVDLGKDGKVAKFKAVGI